MSIGITMNAMKGKLESDPVSGFDTSNYVNSVKYTFYHKWFLFLVMYFCLCSYVHVYYIRFLQLV
jgi:hypothetical protein